MAEEQDFFRGALSDFTFEAASGGAIRHLADLGYSVRQISEKLSYPTPYARVRSTVWQHLLDTNVVLTQEPRRVLAQGKAEYRQERDRYGRTSFRLATDGARSEPVCWRERVYREAADGKLAVYLAGCCERGGEDVYLSCDFGRQRRREPERFEAVMQALNERQREYIEGLPWEDCVCYHRLDMRMREIAVKLYEAGCYRGYCYCLKTAEKVRIEGQAT